MRLRKLSLPQLLILICVLIILTLFRFAHSGAEPTKTSISRVRPTATTAPMRQGEVTPLPSETVLAASSSGTYYPVVKVVDGDTFSVSINGKKETLRLIGINTPETVDPRGPVQCFGNEASHYAKTRLTNASVLLIDDPTQADRDRYGRLLRYAYLPDGSFINQEMIEEGYAYEYTYAAPYRFQQAFRQAELKARESKKGLWGITGCASLTTP